MPSLISLDQLYEKKPKLMNSQYEFYRDNVAHRYYAVNGDYIIMISFHHDERLEVKDVRYHEGPKHLAPVPDFASLLAINKEDFIDFLKEYLQESLGIYERVINLLKEDADATTK